MGKRLGQSRGERMSRGIMFSPAAERNSAPILEKLKELVNEDDKNILEIGAGTGQHALAFSAAFPWVKWTVSDIEENSDLLKDSQIFNGAENISAPLNYECGKDPIPSGRYDIYFTANTFHIMSWKSVKTFIKDLGKTAAPGSRLIVYGPFRYENRELEESNKAFDESLKNRNPASGIRKFEDVKAHLEQRGFRLLKDYEMPANNRLLAFIKI